jgi:hypothetical protein
MLQALNSMYMKTEHLEAPILTTVNSHISGVRKIQNTNEEHTILWRLYTSTPSIMKLSDNNIV